MSQLYDNVLSQSRIKEVLSYYGIALQGKDGNTCVCPFHDDTKPSMHINEKDNYVKCFACGEGANPISFVFKYENKINHNPISFAEAIVKTVQICHLDIDISNVLKRQEEAKYHVGKRRYTEREQELLKAYDRVHEYFSYDLFSSHPTSQEALHYLLDRGFSEELIKEMGLGVARNDYLSTLEKTGNLGFDEITFSTLGLKKEGVDVFRDRIVFPITDAKGNIVAYGGRSISANEGVKYLNTAETDLFRKSEILFNLHSAKNYAYQDQIYLVEGYMDVMGAKGMHIDNAVALMGTSLSETQIQMLKSVKCKITLALDNDEAGKNAILKHIRTLQEQGFIVDVVDMNLLGDYKDFGDLHADKKMRMDVEQCTISALAYVFNYVYFQDKEITTSSIFEVYEKAKEEKWLATTKDKQEYLDYICKHSRYERNAVEDILNPSIISDKKSVDVYKDLLLRQIIDSKLLQFLETRKDKVMQEYYKINKETLLNSLLPFFEEHTEKYININEGLEGEFNSAGLLYEVLNENEDYKQYEQINRFHFQDIFENCFYPAKGSSTLARVQLTQEQKDIIRIQFENTIPNDEKVLLDGVEDVYIIDSLNDLNMLIPKQLREGRREYIKESMQVEGRMQYFNYGSIIAQEQLPFLSDNYKTKGGNFKTILFFNNLDKSMVLTKDNFEVDKEEMIDEYSLEKGSKLPQKKEEVKQEVKKSNVDVTISKPIRLNFNKHDCTTIDNFIFINLPSSSTSKEKQDVCIKINTKNIKVSNAHVFLQTRNTFSYSLYRRDTITLDKPIYLGSISAEEINERLQQATKEEIPIITHDDKHVDYQEVVNHG